MSRTIELPDEVYQQVEQAAAATGSTPAEWIAAQLPQCPPSNGTKPHARTLADEFAGEIGVFGSGRGDLSERISELFAEGMVEKRRNGTL